MQGIQNGHCAYSFADTPLFSDITAVEINGKQLVGRLLFVRPDFRSWNKERPTEKIAPL